MIKKFLLLILVIVVLLLAAFILLNGFKKEVPVAENGTLVITRDDITRNKGIISLKGDFIVYDGIIDPSKLKTTHAKYMTLDEIRLYDYPEGTLTAKMTIKTENISITGIIIDEIYTSNKVFINGTLISSVGRIGIDSKSTIKEKKSVFLPLNDLDNTFEIVIQIANFETISGQLERNIYVGDFSDLQQFYNFKLYIKLLGIGIFATIFFFLMGLYIKNRKHSYLLSLSLAGALNLYYLLTQIEPYALFNIKDTAYLVNSWIHTFPAILVLFLSAVTVILFYRLEPIYKHRKRFICSNIAIFLISVVVLIVFDKISYPIYLLTILYNLGLLCYVGVMSGIRFLQGEQSGIYMFTSLFAYVFSFFMLMYITLNHNPYQTLGSYNIFTILPQLFFYITLCYLSITHFSKQFSISELSEAGLTTLVKEKNTQLQQSIDELKQKDRQRAEMLMNISHDLRSPMTVVKGYVDLFKKGNIHPSMFNEYMDVIYNKVSYVIDLINELLNLAHLENNSKTVMNTEYINIIIDRVLSQYKGEHHSISADIPKDTLILCSGKNIFRLFCNLVDNAIEYSEGAVEIKISGEVSGDEIIIKVIDNGKGIAEKDLSDIFNRFSMRNIHSNELGKHFGLGLAICKAIVQNHNGSISCDSALGRGTTFSISFPLYKGDPDDEATDYR